MCRGNVGIKEPRMAREGSLEGRVRELVAALLAEEGGDVRGEDINDIENAMCRIGDLVAREVGVQKLAAHTGDCAAAAPCPDCGGTAALEGERRRRLITRRGEVPLREARYHCRRCRRNFFPSDDRVGA